MSRNLPTSVASAVSSARIRPVLILVAVFLGALYAWQGRNVMNVDGIAYLDIADAYRHANWTDAINAYYSPLYSWLLAGWLWLWHPSMYQEAFYVHILNFAVYLWTLLTFDQFLQQLLHEIEFDQGSGNRALARRSSWMAFG